MHGISSTLLYAFAAMYPQVTMLIDKTRSNTELLSDMLVNSSAASRSDDFEGELIKDLLTEVRLWGANA